jgi:uncharacterized protein (DUF2344 family)
MANFIQIKTKSTVNFWAYCVRIDMITDGKKGFVEKTLKKVKKNLVDKKNLLCLQCNIQLIEKPHESPYKESSQ